jgi:2-oxoglutarate dehydrogenase E1 component
LPFQGAVHLGEDLAHRGQVNVCGIQGRQADSSQARRLLLCSGKVGVEIMNRLGEGVRLLRVEGLYPFPHEEIMQEVAAATSLEEIVWLQEEPENMGAWNYVLPKLLKRESRPNSAMNHGAPAATTIRSGWSGSSMRSAPRSS